VKTQKQNAPDLPDEATPKQQVIQCLRCLVTDDVKRLNLVVHVEIDDPLSSNVHALSAKRRNGPSEEQPFAKSVSHQAPVMNQRTLLHTMKLHNTDDPGSIQTCLAFPPAGHARADHTDSSAQSASTYREIWPASRSHISSKLNNELPIAYHFVFEYHSFHFRVFCITMKISLCSKENN
jgi:hypothetical protein